MEHTCTYSPEDNKIRMYPAYRLDKELYQRVRNAGFIWAPKQELFVAPMWTPGREDLMLELCGEIGDEDTSLVERAEQRADRFEDYSDKRGKEAEQAKNAVDGIAERFAGGQPILVGHHSEKRARKDAERIENGMRKAVKLWETSQYWIDRAKGATRHAKYLERPDVRHRRIKGLESDIRVMTAKFTPDPKTKPIMQTRWNANPDDKPESHVWCGIGSRGGSWVPEASLPGLKAYYERWIAHCQRRLEYERAMLAEDGGTAKDKFDLKPGGRVLIGSEWLVIIRVNSAHGAVNSVTTKNPGKTGYFSNWKYGIEEIKDYREPDAEDAVKVKALTKLPPICNYPGQDFKEITKADWNRRHSDFKATRTLEATEKHGKHRVRYAFVNSHWTYVWLSDQKRVDPPALHKKTPEPSYEFNPERERSEGEEITMRGNRIPPEVLTVLKAATFTQHSIHLEGPQLERKLYTAVNKVIESAGGRWNKKRQEHTFTQDPGPLFDLEAGEIKPAGIDFEAIKEALKKGVQVVSATQLFPTPPDLCERMVEIADIQPGHSLADGLAEAFPDVSVKCADFMEWGKGFGEFDRILMNPPFEKGADVKHIQHAMKLLKPGGELVAICAGGPRQKEALEPLADIWEPLPAGTFEESGTNVNTVLLTIKKPMLPEFDCRKNVSPELQKDLLFEQID